jgi:23S rRNA-/tRNA-specific pseudouridylate synthase
MKSSKALCSVVILFWCMCENGKCCNNGLPPTIAPVQVEKVYVARILGRPDVKEFTVSCPIRPEPRIRPYQLVDAAAGKESVTHCTVIEEDSAVGRQYAGLFPPHLVAGSEGGSEGATVSTLVELRPHTGR